MKLNPEQAKAARPDEGIHLVLAGAGTGKTRTLVCKIQNLITHGGYCPSELLELTFSRKAAGEIKERVEKDIGRASGLTVGTFHSFSLNVTPY